MRHDAILAIRAGLVGRIDALAAQRGHASLDRTRDEVDRIRHIARSYQFDAVECLAGSLMSVLSLHGHGPVVLSYLDRMRDAITDEMMPVATAHSAALSATVLPFQPRA